MLDHRNKPPYRLWCLSLGFGRCVCTCVSVCLSVLLGILPPLYCLIEFRSQRDLPEPSSSRNPGNVCKYRLCLHCKATESRVSASVPCPLANSDAYSVLRTGRIEHDRPQALRIEQGSHHTCTAHKLSSLCTLPVSPEFCLCSGISSCLSEGSL